MAPAGAPEQGTAPTPDPVVQLILDTIYRDMQTPQSHRDALTDWLLDTKPHTAPLEIGILLPHLVSHHPDLLKRLKNNWRVRDELVSALASISGG
jgi:hypothetical protein